MNITEITKRAGGHPKRKRVGRGEGSGLGKTSGRGHKGEGSRSGGLKGKLYEGGVFPLFRRVPKVGFNNVNFRTEYQVVNLSDLEARYTDGGHVTAASLHELGLIRDAKSPVKILGDGALKKKLTVEAERFSKTAAQGIESAGGTVKRLGPQPKKKFVKRPAPAKVAMGGDEGEGKPADSKKGGAKGEAKTEKKAKGKEPKAEGGESKE
jgi:large subunit ribosomal protein L15